MEWVLNNIREFLINCIRCYTVIVLTFLEINVKVFRSEMNDFFCIYFKLLQSKKKQRWGEVAEMETRNETNIAECFQISTGVHRTISSTFLYILKFYNTYFKKLFPKFCVFFLSHSEKEWRYWRL